MSAERQSPFDRAVEKKEEAKRKEREAAEDQEFENVQERLDLQDLTEEDKVAYDSYQKYLEERPTMEAEESSDLKKRYSLHHTERKAKENEELYSHLEEEDTRFKDKSLKEVAVFANDALEHDDVTSAMDASHYIDGQLRKLAKENGWSDDKIEKQKSLLEKFYDADTVHEAEEHFMEYADQREQQDEADRKEQLRKFEEVAHERAVKGEEERDRGLREEDVVYTGTRLQENPSYAERDDSDDSVETEDAADAERKEANEYGDLSERHERNRAIINDLGTGEATPSDLEEEPVDERTSDVWEPVATSARRPESADFWFDDFDDEPPSSEKEAGAYPNPPTPPVDSEGRVRIPPFGAESPTGAPDSRPGGEPLAPRYPEPRSDSWGSGEASPPQGKKEGWFARRRRERAERRAAKRRPNAPRDDQDQVNDHWSW